jgi:hypothetical protein
MRSCCEFAGPGIRRTKENWPEATKPQANLNLIFLRRVKRPTPAKRTRILLTLSRWQQSFKASNSLLLPTYVPGLLHGCSLTLPGRAPHFDFSILRNRIQAQLTEPAASLLLGAPD